MSRVYTIDRNVYNRPHVMTLGKFDPLPFHQFAVSDGDLFSVHLCEDTVAADLFHTAYTSAVDLSLGRIILFRRIWYRSGFPTCFIHLPQHTAQIRFLYALADRMCGIAFRMCRVLQQFFIIDAAVMDTAHFEDTFGHGAGFVHRNDSGPGQLLQIVGAFHQNTGVARPADPCKKCQRDTDHQCTRTTDHQEGQCAVDPGAPHRCFSDQKHHQRGQQRQRQCPDADRRCIHLRKLGNKVFRLRLSGGRILYQIQNLRDRGFAKLFRSLHADHAGHIDASADHFIALPYLARQALTGQRAGI